METHRSRQGILLNENEKAKLQSANVQFRLTSDEKNKLIRKLDIKFEEFFEELRVILTASELNLWRGGKYLQWKYNLQELNELFIQHSGPQTIYLDRIMEVKTNDEKTYYVKSSKHPITKLIEDELEGKKNRTKERIHSEDIYHIKNILRGLKCRPEMKSKLLDAYQRKLIPLDDPTNAITRSTLDKLLSQKQS